MSSILDALRKLEQEKTERGEVLSTAVAGDILRQDAGRRTRRWMLPAAVFVVVTLFSAIVLLRLQSPPAAPQYVAPLPALAPVATPPISAPVAVAVPVPAAAVLSIPAAPADLPVLSGIVYQPDPAARIAILNDLPVMEGTDIAGYRLHEIRPDRVVLERHHQLFDLSLPQP